MNDELRKEIIQYRMESAEALLKEIDSHINNGFLFARRSAADYEDFLNYDEQAVRELQPQTEAFIKAIHDLIDK